LALCCQPEIQWLERVMLKMKGMRFPKEIILLCIRWYVAYPLNYRNLEEMMHERGVYVDHSSVSRWAVKFLPRVQIRSATF
jgi:transposase-like protein